MKQYRFGSRWILGLLLVLAVMLDPMPALAGGPSAEVGRVTTPDTGSPGVETSPAPSDATPTGALAEGVGGDWWSSVQEEIRRSEYHITWQEETYLDDVPATYQAPNRDQNLRTYFTADGPVVIPRKWAGEDETPTWRLDARVVAWGREGAMATVEAASLDAQENRIAYLRGNAASGASLLERYENSEEGLNQVFAFEPSSTSAGEPAPLRIDLALEGNLVPNLVEGNRAIELYSAQGTPVLRYDNLRAVDAAGRSLPVRMGLSGCGQTLVSATCTLRLSIDDAPADAAISLTAGITGLSGSPDWIETSGQMDAQFGYSVATAGDVNGDLYSDVIVGAPYYDHGEDGEGRVFVYHGKASGLPLEANWIEEPDQVNAHFGWSVATAGDVNGDGYADVIIGAPYYDHGQENEGAAWVYHGSAQGLSNKSANFDEGNQADAWFGYAVATAGDVNGDGYSDVIVSAPWYDSSSTTSNDGYVWVWHGSASGISETNNWRAGCFQDNAHCGTSVATAGDVNRDGYDDVIIGASGFSHWEDWEGVALVWHGSAAGVNGGENGSPFDPDWWGECNQEEAAYGASVSTAGDVNGDGYSDVIVGAPGYTNGQSHEGGAWLYLGSSSGLEDTSANHDEGNQTDALFGRSVSTAGDVNGDGYADVIVGAHRYTNDKDEEGRVWVWHGGPSGISETRDWQYEGNQLDAHFGWSVATAGDVNGDGYSDVIIGSYMHQLPHPDEGAAFVFHGAPGGLGQEAGWTKASNKENAKFGWSVGTAGDVNGDGLADVIVGAPYWDGGQTAEGRAWVYLGDEDGPVSAPHWSQESNMAQAEYGYSVGTAGDVNGDGYDDIIVGAPGWHDGQTDEGGAWVYPGSSTGLDLAFIWDEFSNQEGARFGTSVGTAGDVNGDGFADVIIGAPQWLQSGEERGAAWIYHGSSGGLPEASDWSTPGTQDEAEFGWSVGTAGDVNRDGYSDIIVGEPKWDGNNSNAGRAWVYHGSAGGVRKPHAWRVQGGRLNANFGYAVGTAGDVNGDGYADIIVGAPRWWDDHTNEGKVWVYHGGSGGLGTTSSWRKEGGQSHAHYGYSVGTAGDVNGDGYADVIIGIEGWNGDFTDEGRASVYHGSPDGLGASVAWHGRGGQSSAHYGYSVGTAGDVNGDGYADVIVGAIHYNQVHPFEGKAFLYYGNGQAGLSLNPRQVRASLASVPIARLGWSDWMDAFCIRLSTHSPFGPGRAKMEIEVKPLGVPFDGNNTVVGSTWWADPQGYSRYLCATDLPAGTRYHWRARWRYKATTSPFMPVSRWVTMPWNGWNEQDLRTAGYRALLPILLHDAE